jgi:uncharacterized protein YkwD
VSAANATVGEMRTAVVCLINEQRAHHHLPALTVSGRLDHSAQGWTNTMVAHGFFSHFDGGSNPAARVQASGYNWWSVGENIASGYPTPAQVVSAWMASPGHCRNILDPQYRNVGTGVSPKPVAGAASGPATWTQDFGLPAGASAASGNWGPANSSCH